MRASFLSLLICGILIAGCGSSEAQDPSPLDAATQAKLVDWLQSQGRSPREYVSALFDDHDVVFLGEQHRVLHDVQRVQSLLKPLYGSGVRVLATEFGRREDQAMIDSLITAPEWHEDLAREIVFRQYVLWGYREYVDVYRAAWKLNTSLADGAPRFRVLGIDDSPDWSWIKTPQDRNQPEVLRKVWQGGGEEYWARVILDAVETGEKVLVHCGIHHAFTEYRQPIVVDGEFLRFDPNLRCGNYVYQAIGKRAVTVYLHAPWNGVYGYGAPWVHPADGAVDAVMFAMGPRPVGFDLDEGPFGEIRVQNAVYRHGYENFRLRDFCDGWIYTKPISEYEGVHVIPDWITEANLERARLQCPNPLFRRASIEDFQKSMARDADLPRRFGHLR